MLIALFNVLAPVFITVGLGYAWAKFKLDIDPAFISRLVINIGSPALVFHGLTTMNASTRDFATLAVIAAGMLALFVAVNAVVLKSLGKPLQRWLHPLSFPNWGNLGLPICLFAYGDTGLTLALAFYAVGSVTQLTIGLIIASGEWRPALLMRMPMVYFIGAALLFLGAGTTPPVWLLNTTKLIGGMMIPLMLLSLGASLAQLHIGHVRESAGFVVYRFALGLGLAVGIAGLLELEGVARGVVIIQGAMPIAVLNYLLAARFNNMPSFVASLVLLSTLLTFVTIPLVLLFVL